MEQQRVFWLSGGRIVPKDRSNPDSYKVRRAKVAGYRDDFDPAQLAADRRAGRDQPRPALRLHPGLERGRATEGCSRARPEPSFGDVERRPLSDCPWQRAARIIFRRSWDNAREAWDERTASNRNFFSLGAQLMQKPGMATQLAGPRAGVIDATEFRDTRQGHQPRLLSGRQVQLLPRLASAGVGPPSCDRHVPPSRTDLCTQDPDVYD